MYYAHNGNINNPSQSNGAIIYFAEYQFQKQFENGVTISTGTSNIYNVVQSNLFGNHTSNNLAAYFQYEQKIGKLDIVAGARVEHFQMDGLRGDSDFMISKRDSISIPVYPVFRMGLHYEVAKYTHLRASFGQGIRYPSVAERFTQTSVGALNIFPNPALRPEIGWAAEVGFKQGVKIGDWKGMFDAAVFVNQYSNMMEFGFGVYKPDTMGPLQFSNPNALNYGYNWVGFKAQNAEAARISGVDLSFNSFGSIGKVEIISLIGYTYMNPVSLNNDSDYQLSFSAPGSGLLKYRFKHLAKLDVEANYNKFSVGISCRYNSFMENIDLVFEEAIAGTTFILPGLKEYRQKFNKGNTVFDFRLGYKISEKIRLGLIANNIFNSETTSRPGDIQPPRNYMAQLQIKF